MYTVNKTHVVHIDYIRLSYWGSKGKKVNKDFCRKSTPDTSVQMIELACKNIYIHCWLINDDAG